MSCCKFVLFPQEINILQWEIEFDQDRFKNIEDTWTEKYDRYLTYTVYRWGFCLIFLNCPTCSMESVLCSRLASSGSLGVLYFPNSFPDSGRF